MKSPALLTRREILASGATIAGTIPFLPTARAAAALEPHAAALRLTAGTRTLSVNGKPARVFGLIGPNGKPGITLSPGARLHVDLVNQAGAPTIIHWHGQLPPWMQDGFPWPQMPLIATGDSQSYDYVPIAGNALDALASRSAGTEPDDCAADRAQRQGFARRPAGGGAAAA